jgi:type II secretory pathway pseudopilin PulG
MNTRQQYQHQLRRPAGGGGFTIIELLMSLLLVSMLLTAIALAMKSSMDSYQQNHNASAVNQASRSLALRIQREIRQAVAVDYTAAESKVVITPPTGASGLLDITYTYTLANKTLTYGLRYADTGKNTTETLFNSSSEVELSGFFVTRVPAQGLGPCTKVICTTYFTIDGQSSPLVFTASPRRNQTY